jgi:hypothetical protein
LSIVGQKDLDPHKNKNKNKNQAQPPSTPASIATH